MHQLPVVQWPHGRMLLKLYSTINSCLNRISPKIIHHMIIWWKIILICWFLWSFNSSRMLPTCYLHTFSNLKRTPQWCHLYVGAVEEIIHHLMRMMLRSTSVAEANTAYELVLINLNDKENQLPHELIKLLTATKSLLLSTVASNTSKLFKTDCGNMIKSPKLKLQERSPIKYILVWWLVSFTPDCIIKNKELAMTKFSKLTEKLYDNKQISSKESDWSRVQFEHFINEIAFKNIDKFVSYDPSKCWLYHFYQKYLDMNEKHNYLWKIIIKVFTMSHSSSYWKGLWCQ